MRKQIRFGIDGYIEHLSSKKRKPTIGVVANQSSLTKSLEYTHIALHRYARVKYIFSPQHGFFGTEQANMIESPDAVDPLTGVRVVSIYSSTRKIRSSLLKKIDVLVFDLQDVGSRYYTYLWSLYYAMNACENSGSKLIVLDRPNPINGVTVEGGTIHAGFASFVGLFPLPNRYGLTVGEFAMMLKELKFKSIDLEVVPLVGWRRDSYYDDYANHWVPASPNIPTVHSAVVYPGMCLFEGTNVSEGRGTTRPFEIVGAPFINPQQFAKHLASLKLPGVLFRPVQFRPTFDKFMGKICGGVFLHVTDRSVFRPLRTAISILASIKELFPKQFRWFRGPYEYERSTPAIDLLFGSDEFRHAIDAGKPLAPITKSMAMEEQQFAHRAKGWWLYG